MVAPASPRPDKRPAANRANAQLSTGPRTPEGKARSSMNAVKHGLTGQTALLPGEDAEELRLFAESVEAGLRPLGPMQKILVQRIVSVAWKLRRVAAAEEEAARDMQDRAVLNWEAKRDVRALMPTARDPGPRPRQQTAGRLLADSFREVGSIGQDAVDGRMVRITGYELKLEASLRATMRELRALQKDEAFAPVEPIAEPPQCDTGVPPVPDTRGVEGSGARENSPPDVAGTGVTPVSLQTDCISLGADAGTVDGRSNYTPGENEPVSPAPAHSPTTRDNAGP